MPVLLEDMNALIAETLRVDPGHRSIPRGTRPGEDRG